MELKRSLPHAVSSMILLLIVPYGIETLLEYYQEQGKRLLIVPYGIETYSAVTNYSWTYLLIVPYGIETLSVLMSNSGLTPF